MMKDFLNKTFGLLSKPKNTVASNILYPNLPGMKKYFGDALNINKIDQDAEVSKTLKEFLDTINENGQQFRSIGEDDGTYGIVENSMKEIMRNMASSLRSYVETIFIGLRDSVSSQKEDKKSFVEDAKKEYISNANYLEKITKAYRWKPKSFSYLMGLFYFIIGFVLIAADVFMLKGFIKQGFDEKPLEAFLIALGIGLSTVYIKIFFDMYLFPPLEKSVTRFKKENLPGVNENENEIKTVKKTYRFRLIFHSLILLIVIATLVLLSFLRLETMEDAAKIKYNDMNFVYSIFIKILLVFISLLFPVIGGVSSAVGINKIQNAFVFKQAKNQYKKSRKKLRLAQKELSELQKRLQNCESYVKWCEIGGSFIRNNTDFFYACYLHGYELGFKKQTINMDLFQRAKEMRKHHAARKALLKTPIINS